MNKLPIELTAGAALGEAFPHVLREMSEMGVSRYGLRLDNLPKSFDGLKIAHLSDLHNKLYGNGDCLLAELIEGENPDIIVMTGDMISHDAPHKNDFIAMTERLCKRFPVYYVNGNHEHSDLLQPDFDGVAARMKDAGAVCIDNGFVDLERGDGKIRLEGICYSAKYYRGVRQYKLNWSRFTGEDMLRYAGEKQKDMFTILLAHNPLDFDVYADWGADVTFSGHIHGGFIRLPLVGGVVSPELKLFPKYKEGVYRKDGAFLVVSRGLGRIRFFNPPELVIVKLRLRKNMSVRKD